MLLTFILHVVEGKDGENQLNRIEKDSFTLLDGIRHNVFNGLGVSRELR